MTTPLLLLDLETTGLDPETSEIIEIGAILLANGETTEFQRVVKSRQRITPFIAAFTGISPEEQKNQGVELPTALDDFLGLLPPGPIHVVGHNIAFDIAIVSRELKARRQEREFLPIDTLEISYALFPFLPSYSLTTLKQVLKLPERPAHRALSDCRANLDLWNLLKKYFLDQDPDRQTILAALLPTPLFSQSFFAPPTGEVEKTFEAAERLIASLTPPPPLDPSPPEGPAKPSRFLDFTFSRENEFAWGEKWATKERGWVVAYSPDDILPGVPHLDFCHRKIRERLAEFLQAREAIPLALLLHWYLATEGRKTLQIRDWLSNCDHPASYFPLNALEPDGREGCATCSLLSSCPLGRILVQAAPGTPVKSDYRRYYHLMEKTTTLPPLLALEIDEWGRRLAGLLSRKLDGHFFHSIPEWELWLPDWPMFAEAVCREFKDELMFQEEFHRVEFTYPTRGEFQRKLPFFKKGLSLLREKLRANPQATTRGDFLELFCAELLDGGEGPVFLQFYQRDNRVLFQVQLPLVRTLGKDPMGLKRCKGVTVMARGFPLRQSFEYIEKILNFNFSRKESAKPAPLVCSIHLFEGMKLDSDWLEIVLEQTKKQGGEGLVALSSILQIKKWHEIFHRKFASPPPSLWEYLDGPLANIEPGKLRPGTLRFTTRKNLATLKNFQPPTLFLAKLDYPFAKDPNFIIEKYLIAGSEGRMTPEQMDLKALSGLFRTLDQFRPERLFIMDSAVLAKKELILLLQKSGFKIEVHP